MRFEYSKNLEVSCFHDVVHLYLIGAVKSPTWTLRTASRNSLCCNLECSLNEPKITIYAKIKLENFLAKR